ncbi:DUF6054 family protein [Anaeromicropila herbilytica]|uniref:Uncharacterized protein n=1 Tax=Anaeromicropila herbilytica TaxID=2785025 RepID=A0A7R7EL96_9FIRM|nr:DUF6054 family protein [Anaeromicropila herbilytica]BCN30867.1 hypothetical protein bsdtb5_21620 [Anaeromicropila herbilytica]
MAKYERKLKGNFNDFLDWIHKDIVNGSSSVTYEDGSDIELVDSRIAVRVYERYSMAGGNRVSMNVTVVGTDDDIYVSAITSGGSQAVFFKINTIGEESFLEICEDSVENFIRNQ